MSSTLYKEALLEVEELKKMAEENAKNKIIDAITPQIKQLIESQLMGSDDLELDDLDDEGPELDDIVAPATHEITPPPAQPTAAPQVSIDVSGDVNIEFETEEEDDEMLLDIGSDVVESYIMGKRSVAYKINELATNTRKLSKTLSNVDMRRLSETNRKIAVLYYTRLVREAANLVSGDIIMNESVDTGLLSQLKDTIKEMKQMANRRDARAFRKLLEELEADRGLRSVLREAEEDEMDDDAEEAEEAAPEVDVSAAQSAVSDLAAALGMEVEEASDDDDDDLEMDMDDDEEALELGEADHMEASYKEASYKEADHMEADHMEGEDMDEVYEIDESMLRREILRMREGLEAEKGDPSADASEVGNPMAAQKDFGGSSEVIEVSEADLVEALHAELNRPHRSSRRARVNESRRRARRTARRQAPHRRNTAQLRENAGLRRQLQEMNLFNAKLLFVNKLMQNRDLSKKQQRAIVEALDNAKTINEAKLLFKSLSASFTNSSTLTENKSRLLASSSRSTRSGAPAANGAGGDRWALLAGLTSKK